MISRFIRAFCMSGAALALAACGFTGNLRANPGFAPFKSPAETHNTDRELALSLGPIPVRMARMASRVAFRDEPWIREALKDVRAVRVYAYAIDGDVDIVSHELEQQKAELVADGWHDVVVVREDGGLVSALVMAARADDVIQGLVVLYQDEEDLILVNVIGHLRPETFGAVMSELDIEVPVLAWN